MTALQTLEWEQHGQPATPGKFRSISSGEYYSRLAEFQTVSAIIRALERPLREAAQDTAQINYGHTAILQGTALDNSLRCRASVNKELHRATGELERLQRQRLGDNVPPPLKMI